MDEELEYNQSSIKRQSGQYYTLCIIADPTKNTPPISPIDDYARISMKAESEGLIGVVVNVKENEIRLEKGIEGKLSAWVKYFHKYLANFCGEKPIYFELRPFSFKE